MQKIRHRYDPFKIVVAAAVIIFIVISIYHAISLHELKGKTNEMKSSIEEVQKEVEENQSNFENVIDEIEDKYDTRLDEVERSNVFTEESHFEPIEIPLDPAIQEYAYNMCVSNGVNPEHFFVIMWKESRYNINAIGYNENGTKDYGICQLNDITIQDFNEKGHYFNAMDPYENIEAAIMLMSRYTERYGEYNAIRAYAAGEGGMKAGQRHEYAGEVINGLEFVSF